MCMRAAFFGAVRWHRSSMTIIEVCRVIAIVGRSRPGCTIEECRGRARLPPALLPLEVVVGSPGRVVAGDLQLGPEALG